MSSLVASGAGALQPGQSAVFEGFKAVAARHMDCPASQISAEDSVMSLPGVDSLKLMIILVQLEEHFAVTLPASALGDVRTVGDLCVVIEARRGNG